MQNDLTTGSVFRNVVSFSLPYLLSYFLQTLYGMADLFIIGQFEGVASTTAVSIGSQVMHMLTVMLVGLAMGATVSIAQAAGGGDKKRTASAIGNTVTLFMLLSLALTALLLALRGSIVSIMSTPEEAVQGTLAYLTVCFIGIPFITAYNIIASIFRGLGDSKSPMYFIAVACVVNIALDYYFMGTLHLGPAGAQLLRRQHRILVQRLLDGLELCFLARAHGQHHGFLFSVPVPKRNEHPHPQPQHQPVRNPVGIGPVDSIHAV